MKDKKAKDKEKVPSRPPPWKRIGKAVLVAFVINAIFLVTLFIPVVSFVLVLMVGPYTAAFVGGRYLNKNKRGEWLSATLYIVLIWPTLLTAIIIGVIQSLGLFALQLEPYGEAIISALYIITLIFTLVGFYHGSVDMEEEPAPKEEEEKPKELAKKKQVSPEYEKLYTKKKAEYTDEIEDHE